MPNKSSIFWQIILANYFGKLFSNLNSQKFELLYLFQREKDMDDSTNFQRLNLLLPKGYVIPQIYFECNPERIATALTLGSETIHILSEGAITKVRNETNEEVISKIEKKYDALLKNKEIDLEITQGELVETRNKIDKIRKEEIYKSQEVISECEKKYEGLLKRKQKDFETVHENLEETRDKIRRIEDGISITEERVRKEERKNREEITQEKNERIKYLEQELEKNSTNTKTLTNGIHLLKEQLIKVSNTSNKGKSGELDVEEMLKVSFGSAPSFNLISVAKEGYRGDFIMEYEKAKYLWEVKNYTPIVNKGEIEKFHRDMRTSPDCCMGLMISLNSGIVGHTKAGDIDIEFIDYKRCVVYISNLNRREDKIFYLQGLRPLLEILGKAFLAKTDSENMEDTNKEMEILQQRAILIKSLLHSHQGNIQRHYISLMSHKKRSEQMFAELISFVRESEGQIKEVLKVAMGTGEKLEEQAEGIQGLSEAIFKKTEGTEMNEKERKFIEWFMKVVIIEDEAKILSTELVEKGKVEGFGEKEIRGFRETLFQEMAWQKGGRFILGLKWKD